MTRHRLTTAVTTIALALALVSAGTVSATAQHQSRDQTDDGDDDGLLPDAVGDAIAAAEGAVDRVTHWLANQPVPRAIGFGDDGGTATDAVAAIETYSEDNQDAIVSYATANLPENTSVAAIDSVRLDLRAGGEEETVYVRTEHADGAVTAVDVTATQPDAPIDYTLAFDEFATSELPEDLEMAHAEYVETGADPSALRAYFGGKYYGPSDSHVTITEGEP